MHKVLGLLRSHATACKTLAKAWPALLPLRSEGFRALSQGKNWGAGAHQKASPPTTARTSSSFTPMGRATSVLVGRWRNLCGSVDIGGPLHGQLASARYNRTMQSHGNSPIWVALRALGTCPQQRTRCQSQPLGPRGHTCREVDQKNLFGSKSNLFIGGSKKPYLGSKNNLLEVEGLLQAERGL